MADTRGTYSNCAEIRDQVRVVMVLSICIGEALIWNVGWDAGEPDGAFALFYYQGII
jgi:hypothetical protein